LSLGGIIVTGEGVVHNGGVEVMEEDEVEFNF